MLIWLTIQLFETMFNTTISGDALWFLQAFSFIEMLAEMAGVVIFIVAVIVNQLNKGVL